MPMMVINDYTEMMNRRRFIGKASIGAILALSSVNVLEKPNNTTY